MTTTGKPLPPPVNGKKTQAPPAQVESSNKQFSVLSGKLDTPQRVVIYGPGGIGKSTLAALAPKPVFLDIEGGTNELDVLRVPDINTFSDLRGVLQSNVLDGFQTVVLDTATKAEELATAHTLANTPHEKGHYVKSVEGYGFGKGMQHVFDTFMLLLSDLDRQVRLGRNVVLVAHDCVTDVPNPVGDDWIRYEPHLQAPKSGKASIRNRVIQWADHVLFVGYDVAAKDGKGIGGGTRTIYTFELPSHIAKSRKIRESLPFTTPDDSRIWDLILGVRHE
ncbi:MAG TPA: ATP-binding protein [Candidatus Krumholzibacteria bacterium]|nr:ATP-binding protein [Candidatus Krumholzibacteria bacterium]HPD73544.1 ATP-binding protein [Candidatus Krumholzibacteria bacterium]HRY42266.1 ATP-binding protein [Candidatus Krumholzibacteria bacterium]